MELFAKIAHEKDAGVIVVTHDHRTLDVFDRILDVEDGMIKTPVSQPAIGQSTSFSENVTRIDFPDRFISS